VTKRFLVVLDGVEPVPAASGPGPQRVDFQRYLSLRLQSQTVPPAVTRDTRQPRSLIPVVGNDVAVSRNEEGHNLKVTLVQFGIVCQQLAHIAVLALAGGYVSQRVQDCGETQDALQPLCECPQCRAQAR